MVLEDFVCAVAIMLRGPLELRLRFTFLAVTAAGLGAGSASAGGLDARRASHEDIETVRLYAKYGTSAVTAKEAETNGAAALEILEWLGVGKDGAIDFASFREWAAVPLIHHRSADADHLHYAATAAWAARDARDHAGLQPGHVGPDDDSPTPARIHTPTVEIRPPPPGTPGAPSFPGQPA